MLRGVTRSSEHNDQYICKWRMVALQGRLFFSCRILPRVSHPSTLPTETDQQHKRPQSCIAFSDEECRVLFFPALYPRPSKQSLIGKRTRVKSGRKPSLFQSEAEALGAPTTDYAGLSRRRRRSKFGMNACLITSFSTTKNNLEGSVE